MALGAPAIFEGSLIMILCYHRMATDYTPHLCLSLKQYVSNRSVNRRKVIGGWFHVIINIHPLITEKGNIFCLIVGVEKTSFKRVPWGRWWVGRISDLWWRRGRLFVKEAFSCPLFLGDSKPLGIMEGLTGNVSGI